MLSLINLFQESKNLNDQYLDIISIFKYEYFIGHRPLKMISQTNKIIMAQIFRKDRKQWSTNQQQQVDYFFRGNQFFSKFYEQLYFQDIIQMVYYAKISPDSSIFLTDNKRPTSIILIKGNIAVFTKQIKQQKKHRKGHLLEQFRKVTQLLRTNQTIILSSQCKITALHGEQAQILFVPSYIYNKFVQKCKDEKDQITFNMLIRIFQYAENRDIMDMAKSGCKVKQLRINNYIYEQGQKPQSVYIIIEGSVKIQRPGFSHKNMQIVVISTDSLVGEKDITFQQRQSSAVCCSAFVRLLQIPRQSFLKFAKIYMPEIKSASPLKYSSLSPTKSNKESLNRQSQGKLPMIMRFRSASKKSQQQSQRQYKLIKNSHILLNVAKPNKHKIRSRSSFQDYPKDMLQEKIKFYKKIRPNATGLDLTNRIF